MFNFTEKCERLLSLEEECRKYTKPVNWLFRGQGTSFAGINNLRMGLKIVVDTNRRPLLSWTTSHQVASNFANNSHLPFPIVIKKQGLDAFFDFKVFAHHLDVIGFNYHSDTNLADPISENEVIVKMPIPLRITSENIDENYL